jgi:hypothetical protein
MACWHSLSCRGLLLVPFGCATQLLECLEPEVLQVQLKYLADVQSLLLLANRNPLA